jgi:hypothetical protein
MSLATFLAIALTVSGAAPRQDGACLHANLRAPATRLVAECTASSPRVGEPFAGPVLQVIDGRTVCVALGPTPDQWIRVSLADGKDATPRAALMDAVFAQRVVCVRDRAGGQGVVAHCALDGISLGSLDGNASAP